MNFKGIKYLVVGCGFSGAVIAERIAQILNQKVIIIDKRPHLGGNAYSALDKDTGIEYHHYGTHVFHTNDRTTWEYIQQFGSFMGYQHNVYAQFQNQMYNLPINLNTMNAFFKKNMSPHEAVNYLKNEIPITPSALPNNFEEQAISLMGNSLYQAFVKGYTYKQWGKDPRELPLGIISRLPVRYNYNNNYYNDVYQGLPELGYTTLFKNMLRHSNIEIMLGVDFFDIRNLIPQDCIIIYTGAIDQFFEYKYGKLDWRSLHFEKNIQEVCDFQGTAQINYTDVTIPYTRSHEFKHLHPERAVFKSHTTLLYYEYPRKCVGSAEPYYPINDVPNNIRYNLYAQEAENYRNVIFSGRLGLYKYLDMDKAIESALNIFEENIHNKSQP